MAKPDDGKPIFESKSCSRCGGSGHYSYCPQWGTTCFQCSGRGWVYTKRGAAAAKFYNDLLTLPARHIQPGMKFKSAGYRGWVTALTNDNGDILYDSHSSDGNVRCLYGPDSPIRRCPVDAAELEAVRANALAYQDTLTKQGTPRKVRTIREEDM